MPTGSTRLEAFAASLVTAILDAYGDGPESEAVVIATRRIREFTVAAWATAWSAGYTDDDVTANDYLDGALVSASALREEGPSSGREGKVPKSDSPPRATPPGKP